MEKVMGCIGAIIAVVVIVLIGMFINAWAFTNMWSWFVVPFGVIGLSYPHAMGLSALIGLTNIGRLTRADLNQAAGEETSFVAMISTTLSHWLSVVIVVGVCYIVKSYM